MPNTILTPHIGGSTKEAQKNIGTFVPNKIIDFINTGASSNSVNFPSLVLPELQNAHRFIHIHENIPNVMLKINKILSEFEVNILGQYLKTNDKIGYVITDINKKYNKNVIKRLKDIKGTIKLIKIKPFKEVIVKERTFTTSGEEITAFRFKTDKVGNILEVNELPAKLVKPLQQ